MRFCFTPDDCVEIPELVVPWRWWPWPWPDPPWREKYDELHPRPNWLESTRVSRETVLDMSALASIEDLVGGLRNAKLRDQLSTALKDALPALALPTDMVVHLDL